ncbi:MAG: AMIN domain-containing protein, partial [Alphaproteobacteria bacterium]
MRTGRSMPGLRIGWLLLLWVISLLSAPGHAEPVVSGLRLGENGSQTRFVIDIDEAAEPEIFTLANPYRLVIDLPLVRFDLKGQGRGEGRGIVERFRYGRFNDTRSRIVLDLSAPARLQRFFTLPPQGPDRHRLVFDLEPVTRESFLAGIRRPQKMAARAPEPVATAPSARPATHNGRRI